jgi:hypothetical protein
MNGIKVDDWYHYSGAIHVHTTESDGTKSLEEVAGIAQEVGLGFVMFTDHMTLSNRDQGKEGFYGGTLAVVGYEHNDPEDNNHYLLFESPAVYPRRMTAGEYVRAGASDRALGIIAHPDEVRSREGHYPPYPWTDWKVEGFQGIELWNQMSEWMERLGMINRLFMAFSPRKSMIAPAAATLERWDQLNLTRKVFGVASVDAHAFPIKIGPMTVEIFPYKVHFRSLQSFVILPEPFSSDFATAKRQLFDALLDCRVFGANVRWGDPSRFRFAARAGDERVISGGRLSSAAGAQIEVHSPDRARIILVRNGERIAATVSDRLEFSVTAPGLYRVEVWKHGRGWIFSNHIRIGI